jgi:uncharacterized protein (DUF983 family)
MLETWLSSTSLLVLGGLLLTASVIALFVGASLRKRRGAPASDEVGNFVLSSVLGLLALLLGFTFSLATERFEARRLLVLNEANAIGTAYLRTQLLDEPYRSHISDTLVRYTRNRIAFAQAPPDQAPAMAVANDQLIEEFWSGTAAAFPSIKNLDFSSTYVEAANNVIDLDEARKSARLSKVPAQVFVVLFVYVIVSAGVLGIAAPSRQSLWFGVLFLLLLTLSLLLIVDIDRPTRGLINESQGPMQRLLVRLEQREQARLSHSH